MFNPFHKVFEKFRCDPSPAYFHIDENLTYADLHVRAAALSKILKDQDRDGLRLPIMIYGHKNWRYLVAYWACIISGRPLIPIEPDIPVGWIEGIRDQTKASLLLDATSTGGCSPCESVDVIRVPGVMPTVAHSQPLEIVNVAPRDTMYIMFSSGTTGSPKGIKVSYGNVADFLNWLKTLFSDFGPIEAITSTVRFCFDVSLFELWTSWLLAKPMSALDHSEFFNTRKYIGRFRENQVTTWFSTPTIMRRYLADPFFRVNDLPTMNTFLFCGEVLTKDIVMELWNRFEGCKVFNTYGPTECTVAVTCVQILPSHVNAESELPIGYARPGTRIELVPQQPGSNRGEIVIHGRAVGLGYLNAPVKQSHCFPEPQTYRTGDLGHVQSDGLWFFDGRMDRECKIQGVRVDLNDIEACIRGLPGVFDVVTEIHRLKGEPYAIDAFVLGPISASQLRALAQELARKLPVYLIPRFWYAVPELAQNLNSKLDKSSIINSKSEFNVRYVYRPEKVSVT